MDFIVRTRAGFEPNADVFVDEERAEIVVVVEVAGADPESLHVWLDERYLSITGKRSDALPTRGGSFIQKEIAYGPFAKRFPLPVAVDFLGDATAHYIDGVLVISLPIARERYVPSTRTEIRMIVKRTLS
jgi:HSP20 family molecular chaperone IbpA